MTEIQELLKKRYSKLGEIDSITTVQAHEINSNNFILQTKISKNKYICKIVEKDARIYDIIKILEYCSAAEQRVSKVIKDDRGNRLNELNGFYFYVLGYEEGNIFSGDIEEIKSLALNLACLHKIPEKYEDDISRVRKHENYLPLSKEELERIHDKIYQKNRKSPFDEFVLEKLDFIADKYIENHRYFSERSRQLSKKQIIHGDLNVMNVIFLDGRLQIFLDFNHAHHDDRIREVAFACMRFALHDTNDKVLIKKRILAFLKEYNLNNRLSDLEEQSLKQYYINECLKRISYILRNNYFHNDSKWNFDLNKHIDNIMLTICSET